MKFEVRKDSSLDEFENYDFFEILFNSKEM